MKRRFVWIAVLGLNGCATSFTGDAHVPGGRSGCASKCAAEGMTMSGLVFMGEYSSACICEPPGAAGGRGRLGAGAAAATGAAGVEMQRQRAQQQQAAR